MFSSTSRSRERLRCCSFSIRDESCMGLYNWLLVRVRVTLTMDLFFLLLDESSVHSELPVRLWK